jgi:hypothetical protein
MKRLNIITLNNKYMNYIINSDIWKLLHQSPQKMEMEQGEDTDMEKEMDLEGKMDLDGVVDTPVGKVMEMGREKVQVMEMDGEVNEEWDMERDVVMDTAQEMEIWNIN